MITLWTALYLALPLVVAGVLHMLVVKLNLLAFLNRPVAAGMFGPNKTVRGFVVMPLATVLGVYAALPVESAGNFTPLATLRNVSPIVLGLALGLAYMLAELPNSFWKRRLGIQAGELPESNRFLFAFVDQADSALGCAIAYVFLVPVPLRVLAIVTVVGPAVHLIVNVGLYSVGLRKRPL